MDAVLRGDEAGEKGGAGGGADGIAAQGTGKADALGGHPVDVWRADVRVSVAAEGPGTLVVRQDEDEVHRLGGSDGGEKQAEEGKKQAHEAENACGEEAIANRRGLIFIKIKQLIRISINRALP
jgi:hypothetical protein